jgi:hypothetical protein
MASLASGKYTAVAESMEGASDRVPFEVTEGTENELKLILHPSLRITFSVVSSQGPVADAAVQVWIAPGVPRAFKRTDQEGHFVVTLPQGTVDVGLTVGAPGYALKMARVPVVSGSDLTPDANIVTLDASAGTLVLNFQTPERAIDNSVPLYLVHNGDLQDARTLAGWGTDQAGSSGDGPTEIEAIEPGDYALCLLPDPSQLASIWMGALPPAHCRKGALEPGQSLTLTPR